MSSIASWLGTDHPGLPALWLVQLWLPLGWGTVLAWLGARVGGRMGLQRRTAGVLATALVASAWLPGPYAPTHWLGLAFQGPSVLVVLLCATDLYRRQFGAGRAQEGQGVWRGAWLAAGVLLGWTLLLDTFALLPVSLYAWGFSAAVSAGLVLLAVLPWVWLGGPVQRYGISSMVLVALAASIVLRLPSGNVWDALLDPWLWMYLQVLGVRMLFARRSSMSW